MTCTGSKYPMDIYFNLENKITDNRCCRADTLVATSPPHEDEAGSSACTRNILTSTIAVAILAAALV